jgi:hypothetical protein
MVSIAPTRFRDPWNLHPILWAAGVTALYLLLFGACLLALWLAPLPPGVERNSILAGTCALSLSGLLLPLMVVLVITVLQRFRRLDAAFLPLGLRGQLHGASGRQYHGHMGKRRLDAYFFGRYSQNSLYLGTSLQTRAKFTRPDPLGRDVPRRADAPAGSPTEPVLYSGSDEAWLRSLLADPRALASLQRLVAVPSGGAGPFATLYVLLEPDAWQFVLAGLSLDYITADHVQAWLKDLQTVADIAETLPPPQVTATASSLERYHRTQRGAATQPLAVINLLLAVPVVLALIGCPCLVAALFYFN